MVKAKGVAAFGLLVLFLSLSGCVHEEKPLVVVENRSGFDLENVVVETRNNSVSLGSIPSGETRTAVLENRFGESDVRLSYLFQGEEMEWNGSYIESGYFSCYRVALEVGEGGNVEEKGSSMGCE